MRRLLVLLVMLVPIGGCSDGKETVETPAGEVAVPEDVADALRACEQQVTSGEAMTRDEVESCAEINFTASVDCGSGKLYVITLGEEEQWALLAGEPAQQVADPFEARMEFC